MSIIIDGKEYYGIIYKIENIINHHVYIGQTSEPDGFNGRYRSKGKGIERVYNYCISKKNRNLYYNPHLFAAIEKYGLYAFVVDEVFDVALTFEELNDKEAFYVKQFDSFCNGYNLTAGGDRKTGYQPPSGKDCRSSKRVCQISIDGELIKIWDSFGEIQRKTRISKGSVVNVCMGNKKTAGGFIWAYEEDYDPNKNYNRIPKIKDGGKGTKPVLLLDEDNNILQEFYSVNHVGEILEVSA